MGESHITFVVQIDLNKKVHQLDFDQVETEEMKNDKRITPAMAPLSLGLFPVEEYQ